MRNVETVAFVVVVFIGIAAVYCIQTEETVERNLDRLTQGQEAAWLE